MRDWREAPARGRARVRSVCARAHVRLGATFDMAARADFWPVSGCDSCVRWSGPENVTNSAAAARNGQSGICRHRLEDESSMEFYSSRSVGAITSEFLSSKKRSEPKNRRILTVDLEKAVFCLTGSSPNERVTSVHVQVKPPSRFLGSFAEGGSFVTPLSTVPVCGRVGGLGWL